MEKKLYTLVLLALLATTSITVLGECAGCYGDDDMMVEEDPCDDGSCEDDIVIEVE